MNHLYVLVLMVFGLPGNVVPGSPDAINDIYFKLENAKPSFDVFQKAYEGYMKIGKTHSLNSDKPLLTVIDLNLPSNEKRLWVIDLKSNEILFHTYASHGRNSGELYANKFSNIRGSCQSSLGFYITGNTYEGRNGYSMYLDGLEKDFNHKAFKLLFFTRSCSSCIHRVHFVTWEEDPDCHQSISENHP
ncbi:MAG: murein L,D-transpeptidase catalytic domain family protein [Cyclobacteriaceae bacterium]|nr:murein L,D-transpeptidase catalytic domain family protein [Cyclobacteriaceae bacterium]